jgi:glucose/arabinose dehydrogenase
MSRVPSRPIIATIALLAVLFAATQAYAQAAARLAFLGTFENPTFVTVAPGEPGLLFVVERPGAVRLLRNEVRLTPPFLDIRDIVFGPPDADAGSEQGLFSIAFAPDYATSRRFYVAFTNNNGDIEIDEFRRSPNPERANPNTRRVLLTIPHPDAKNHNGGQLHFGPDGFLYISTGDGAISPTGENARKLNNLLGKILRINPLPVGTRPYGIPASNPFVDQPGLDEIFAYGLRNPWRLSFDGTRIAIADVGQNSREEVNFLPLADARGVNFGWPQFEGDLVFDNTRPGPDPATFPMFVYDHNAGRCAIIGGYVVHNPNLPALDRRYIYGDACTGEIRSFFPRVGTQEAFGDRTAGISLPGLSSFGQGFHGRIYTAQINGRVNRLAPPP